MIQWATKDRTLVCLQASEAEINSIVEKFNVGLRGEFSGVLWTWVVFYDEDFGFQTWAIGPMTKEDGDKYFGHLRLA